MQCITNNSIKHQSFVYTQLNDQTVLFITIQFNLSLLSVYMSNSFIWSIDRTLSGATTSGQSGPGSNGNEGVLHIHKSYSITGASPSNCLMSYTGHSLVEGVLPLCRDAVSVFSSPSQLGYQYTGIDCSHSMFRQFSINKLFSSIWPIDRTLSGATTPGQSETRSDGNKGVLHIPQSSSITETSPTDCLVSYPGTSLGVFHPSAEIQFLYSTAPANWATKNKDLYFITSSHIVKFVVN